MLQAKRPYRKIPSRNNTLRYRHIMWSVRHHQASHSSGLFNILGESFTQRFHFKLTLTADESRAPLALVLHMACSTAGLSSSSSCSLGCLLVTLPPLYADVDIFLVVRSCLVFLIVGRANTTSSRSSLAARSTRSYLSSHFTLSQDPLDDLDGSGGFVDTSKTRRLCIPVLRPRPISLGRVSHAHTLVLHRKSPLSQPVCTRNHLSSLACSPTFTHAQALPSTFLPLTHSTTKSKLTMRVFRLVLTVALAAAVFANEAVTTETDTELATVQGTVDGTLEVTPDAPVTETDAELATVQGTEDEVVEVTPEAPVTETDAELTAVQDTVDEVAEVTPEAPIAETDAELTAVQGTVDEVAEVTPEASDATDADMDEMKSKAADALKKAADSEIAKENNVRIQRGRERQRDKGKRGAQSQVSVYPRVLTDLPFSHPTHSSFRCRAPSIMPLTRSVQQAPAPPAPAVLALPRPSPRYSRTPTTRTWQALETWHRTLA